MFSRKRKGFTLIELLTVIAVIGILAAILVPAVGAATRSARRAQTKAMLNGLVTSLSQYKTEYGYWPNLGNLRKGEAIPVNSNLNDLITALSKQDDKLNRKGIKFHEFGDELSKGEGNTEEMTDSEGGTKIFMAVDHDNDGIIKASTVKGRESDLRAKVALWTLETDGETVFSSTYDTE